MNNICFELNLIWGSNPRRVFSRQSSVFS
jgi:hypothetical protein